jgi:hypothetical protein
MNDNDAMLTTILDHWNSRRQKSNSIRYEAVGEGLSTKGCFSTVFREVPDARPVIKALGEIPAEDSSYPCAFTLLADLSKGRVRIERERTLLRWDFGRPERTRFAPSPSIEAFDGAHLRTLAPGLSATQEVSAPGQLSGPGAQLSIQNADAAAIQLFGVQELPILLAHGYVPVDANVDVLKLVSSPHPDGLRFAGQAMIGDKPCVVLRTEPSTNISPTWREYWVDVSRASAVLHAKSMTKSNVVTSVDIDYGSTPDGWMPESWVCYECLPNTKGLIGQMFRYVVKRYAFGTAIADADFDIARSPGLYVIDSQQA